MDDITTCYERGGQPEWDNNDYSRDFTYWGIDRSQPITLPLNERLQPMSGISEFAREEEEATITPEPEVNAAGEQRIDIGELLIAIKVAYERMGNGNTHKGLLVTAGSVIIHFVGENAKLHEENRLLKEALVAARDVLRPQVSLI